MVVDLTRNGCAIPGGDEAACQKWSGGGYAWRPRGGCDTVDASFSKAAVKMFGALGKDGHRIQAADALNSDTFMAFLKSLLKTCPKFALVLDNASCHRSAMVNEFIESAGGSIVLIFLPACTPQLNPIEVQWGKPRRLPAGQCFESLGGLKDAIGTIVAREMKSVKLMSYLTDEYKPP